MIKIKSRTIRFKNLGFITGDVVGYEVGKIKLKDLEIIDNEIQKRL